MKVPLLGKLCLAALLLAGVAVRAQQDTTQPPPPPPPAKEEAAPPAPGSQPLELPAPPPTGTGLPAPAPAGPGGLDRLRAMLERQAATNAQAAAALARMQSNRAGLGGVQLQRSTNQPPGAPGTAPVAPAATGATSAAPAGAVPVPSATATGLPAVPPAGAAPAVAPAAADPATAAAAAAPLLSTSGPSPMALTVPPDGPATNTVDFPSIELVTFLKFYAEYLGRTILRPSTLPAQQITLKTQNPLTTREMVQAMDTVLAMNGITTIPVGEKFVKVVPTQQAVQEAMAFYKGDTATLPEAAQYLTFMVQVTNVKPSELSQVLTPFAKIPNSVIPVDGAGIVFIRDFAENAKRMLEIIKQIDVAVPDEFVSEVIPIKYALASEIASALNSLSAGGSSTSLGGGGGGTMGSGGMGGGMGGGIMGGRSSSFGRSGSYGRGGYGMGGYGGYGGVTQFGLGTTPMPGIPGAGGATAAGQPSFSDRLRGIIQRASGGGTGEVQILGTMKIIADERTNSLLIFANRKDMATIKDIIAKLDVVLAQVLIEAMIFEVGLRNSVEFGVSWLKRPVQSGEFNSAGVIQNTSTLRDPRDLGSLGSGTNSAFQSGLSWWGKYNDDFDVAVRAAASDSNARILSRPRVQTSHAVQADLFIGETRPYPTGSYYGGGMYGGYSSINQQNIGISLSVLPLINPDGLVIMDVHQNIESLGGEVEIANVGKVPVTIRREASAKVAVRDRETIILGGFITSEKRNADSGVPLLKDIPLLGLLFKGVSKSTDRTELIVLLRPTVLPTPEVAAITARTEKNKMPLVVDAERDEAKAQDETRKKAKKAEALGEPVELR